MLSWRLTRQLTVVFVLFVMLAGISFWIIWRLLPPATCSDNKKNQGEVQIDCGGPCAPCELKNPKQVVSFWARVVPVRPRVYDVAAEVENPNTLLSSRKFRYQFTLFDEFGPVAVREGTTYIYSQERLHVIETNLETTRDAARVEFKILGVEWQLRDEKYPNILVETQEYHLIQEERRTRSIIESSVVNRTSYDFREVEFRVVVLDGQGNLLGTNRVVLDRFLSDSRRTIKFIWPEAFGEDIGTIVVEPRVNIFDPSVIIKPQ